MTQRETVFKMLTDAANSGVTSNQFFASHLPRFSARIHELRNEGHHITKEPVEDGHWLYRLRQVTGSSPRVAAGNSPQGDGQQGAQTEGAGDLLQVGLTASSGTSTACGVDATTGKQLTPGSTSSPEPGGLLSLFEMPSRLYEDAA